MSTGPHNTSSHETTSSDDADIPPGDAAHAREAAISGSHLREDGPPGVDATKHRSRPARLTSRSQHKAKGKGSATAQYRELLNSVIQDAVGHRHDLLDVLPSSQVGASYWTSAEKEALFDRVVTCTPGDYRALSKATVSKSEAEIMLYLDLLRDGVDEVNVTSAKHDAFPMLEVAAAYEVSDECEASLDAAADALAKKVESYDAHSEQKKHGEDWLLDDSLAAKIELMAQQAQEAEDAKDGDGEKTEDTALPESTFPSATLLRPEAFLHLSREYFMNARPGSGGNWRDLQTSREDDTGPAIYRTAFDDFHNLVVSLTRRLVQAAIFQATTRLRARDECRTDWAPGAEIRGIDVRTAVELLRMRTGWKVYWAGLPRRCGFDVYTDIGKYKDGRLGTKNGVKLNLEEAEAELGLEIDGDVGEGALARFGDDESLHQLGHESDDFTEDSDNDKDLRGDDLKVESSFSEHEKESDSSSLASSEPKKAFSRKRKRALSPRAFIKAAEQYLDSVDRRAGDEETGRLWELLGKPPRVQQQSGEMPLIPEATDLDKVSAGTWKSHVVYQALWELSSGALLHAEFGRVAHLGRVGRERRRRVREQVLSPAEPEETASNGIAPKAEPASPSDSSEETQGLTSDEA
ncbi:hypothetical protein LTR53_000533 [Teratosphaeriaceae sp. CCFEE 6253]|nr:hypothetical protein LTR53_000533 [Teratosphaeriaceae sp. CCFEE 6253]